VVSDLATAIGLNNGNLVRVDHMGGVCSQPKGVDRRMLDQPQLVRRVAVTRIGKGAHGSKTLLVRLDATAQNQQLVHAAYSTTLTIACDDSSR
jgi:hypothetical protein